MTPERWQQIRDVLEKALHLAPEQRSAFLRRACSSDSSLRQEVETLLASSDEVRSDFLQSSPPRVALSPGTKLADYEVKSLLGSGGMGEVYRARDARLGRDVAIKVLPSALSADSERLRRFEQEARAAATLNHPNILAVFQMGTYEGAPYLVSELLEGETLRELLKRGRLVVRKVIDYGVHIARGLAAAHEKGIVHRDLKPENLFVTKDGRVKILDFGLAKLMQRQPGSEPGAPTMSAQTEPGVVMGTAGYMSPEQVRGQAADYRTDIFSFGAILYEMLTGKRAFQKPTSAETMSSILNEDPASISAVTANLSPALQRVVHRCLEKSPEQRFQSASDLAFALDALDESSGSAAALVRQGNRKLSKLWAVGGTTVAALAVALGFFLFLQPSPIKLGRGTQITNDGRPKKIRSNSFPSLVTDGARLYFNELLSGKVVIAQVATVGGETGVIPTTLPFPRPLDISPRGSELLITSGDDYTDNPLWILPLPAGSPRRLGDVYADGASWSPDGQHIAYNKGMSELYIVNADGTGNRRLFSAPDVSPSRSSRRVTFSPDGKRLRFDLSDRQIDRSAFWEVNADGSNPHQVLAEDWNDAAFKCCQRWMPDARYLLFQSYRATESNLWALPDCRHSWFLCKPQPFRLTNGPLLYSSPLPNKDAARIFAVGEQKRAELVRYDARSGQYSLFLSGISGGHVSFSFDGQWVAWVSYPENTLWCGKADGSERHQLTFPPLLVVQPRWSRDGKRIAFTALQPGQPWRIYMVPRDGGAVEPMLVEQRSQLGPAWAPDGTSIAFGRVFTRDNSLAINFFDLKSGKVSELSGSQDLVMPNGSPDGRYLTAATMDSHHIKLFDYGTGKWSNIVRTFADVGEGLFSHDSKYFYFEDAGDATIYRASVPDLKIQRVANFRDLRRPSLPYWQPWFGLAPDDSLLAMRDLRTQEIYSFDLQ